MYKGAADIKVATASLEFPNETANHLNEWTANQNLDIVDVQFFFPQEKTCQLVIFYRGEKEK